MKKERTYIQIMEMRKQAEGWLEHGFKVNFDDKFGTFITFEKTYNPLNYKTTNFEGKQEVWGLGRFTNTMNIWLKNPENTLKIAGGQTL